MKRRCFVAAMASTLLTSIPVTLWAGLKVEPDKENVVASRLEGGWQVEAGLTQRLTGKSKPTQSPFGLVSFKDDRSIVEKIPAKYEEFLGAKRIYMAGIMKYRGKDHPFILIEHRGNPHVVYFGERGGDPLGDAESFNVMLAVAKDKQSDLLFIGGDFNNQPFTGYERVKK